MARAIEQRIKLLDTMSDEEKLRRALVLIDYPINMGWDDAVYEDLMDRLQRDDLSGLVGWLELGAAD